MYCHTKQKILRKKFCMTIEKNLDKNQKPDLRVLYDNKKNLDKKISLDLKVLYDNRKK